MSAALVSSSPTVVPLLTFCGATMLIFTMSVRRTCRAQRCPPWHSCSPPSPLLRLCVLLPRNSRYGGGFATIPAYLADVFGTKYVGGIHGRLLTAWSTAGVLGPFAITHLRKSSFEDAVSQLAAKVDSDKFEQAFGAPVSELDALVSAKTVTIARLMDIAPAGTTDPTPFLYNSTMYAMAGFLGVAAVANAMVRPVDPKYWLPEETDALTEPADAGAGSNPRN